MTTKKLIEYRDRLRAIEKTIISQFIEEWAKLRDLGNELDEEIAKQKRKEQRLFRIETGEELENGDMENDKRES